MRGNEIVQIEYLPLSILKEYDKNARTHSPSQVEQIANSIESFGFNNPVLIDSDNLLIAGHGRLAAARLLKLKKIPCIRLGHLTERERRAYTLADNRIALNSGWNYEILASEVNELLSEDFDVDVLGFNAQEIDSILKLDESLFPKTTKVSEHERRTTPEIVEDQIEDPETNPAPVRAQYGDVWSLGVHRVMCGDSMIQGDVDKLLNGSRPKIMVTDPPYGVNYDPSWREHAHDKNDFGQLGATKNVAVGTVANDDKVDFSQAFKISPCEVLYIWHANLHAGEVVQGIVDKGFVPRAFIIWAKPHFILSRGHYHWQHEPCCYAVKANCTADWIGDRSQSTLWQIKDLNPMGRTNEAADDRTGHPTQKPVECMARPIANHAGEVYDPFGGSGSTIIAGEQLFRPVFMMEKDPRNVDMIINRWEKFTGKKAQKWKS